jgi:hypothetical protein
MIGIGEAGGDCRGAGTANAPEGHETGSIEGRKALNRAGH